MRTVLLAVLLGSVATFAGVACSSSTSTSSSSPGSGDGGPAEASSDGAADVGSDLYPLNQVCPGPDAGTTEACDVCRDTHCCDTRAKLFGRPDSQVFVDCVKAAADEVGQAACFDAHPPLVQPFLDHLSCLTHRCANECGGGQSACGECIDEKCLPDQVACDLNRDCYLNTGCVARCDVGDQVCIKACWALYPEAEQLNKLTTVCSAASCGACASSDP